MNEEELDNKIIISRNKDQIAVCFDPLLISEIGDFVMKNNIDTLYFKKSIEKISEDISIINTWPSVTKISIINNSIDFRHIALLNNIRELYIHEFSKEIDFSKFPNLKFCTLDWNNKIRNLDKCNELIHLVIWKYNPKEKNIKPISFLRNLEQLEIKQSNILTLEGIEDLNHLKNFELHYATKLISLNGVGDLKNSLNYLFIDNSKKIEDHNKVKSLSKLHTLALNDCGNINSLDFIEEMPNLKELRFFNSNIVDGNLKYCEKLETVLFNDKRHYTHKHKQFQSK